MGSAINILTDFFLILAYCFQKINEYYAILYYIKHIFHAKNLSNAFFSDFPFQDFRFQAGSFLTVTYPQDASEQTIRLPFSTI